jgi:hypothetical protein
LQVIVLDAAGQPVAGGKDRDLAGRWQLESFYTGLYPEISAGYADYAMQPGVV